MSNPVRAVVIPGGGIDDNGRPRPWVTARLDRALEIARGDGNAVFLLLSRGTSHRPPPRDAVKDACVSSEDAERRSGFPLDESTASARYLIDRGVEHKRIMCDGWSLDTIGNAYFCRFMMTDPLGIRSIHVITNAFHMPRTRAIFEWVYAVRATAISPSTTLVSDDAAMLSFDEVPDVGLEADALAARREKEASGLEALRKTRAELGDGAAALAQFLFLHHNAYVPAAAQSAQTTRPNPALNSY
mmetsp:Transcript_13287/g.35725  ORF Transcript_13287/g.35725 Transcript_13287/m.35725 type:complete len:244 (-) Transcript_13287:167-898(-)|eukprot:CAMPEP_0185839892 /NCGR_PEP_ID=MMETSP1353-20130828/15357_1 /TAXON_ID=1077150 /ORGANISM="Erythrolobus australicus, Strain CCMP3124" /LENGTH=243 /DNA_ID=CAMNT_0028539129 /DNA_START=54 /DNA_END=785 /DNA_ORIENTATION=+